MAKQKIVKGDFVEVICGNSKGDQGEVYKVKRSKKRKNSNRYWVRRVNLKRRHRRPTNEEEKKSGVIEEIELPFEGEDKLRLLSKKDKKRQKFRLSITMKDKQVEEKKLVYREQEEEIVHRVIKGK